MLGIKKTNKLIFLLFVVFSTLFLFSCVKEEDEHSDDEENDLPVETQCSPVSYLTPRAVKPVFFFFLIDGTKEYYENGGIKDTEEIIKNMLSSRLQTGDHVVLGWINQKTLGGVNDAVFYDSTFIIRNTSIATTPTVPPSPMPFVVPSDIANSVPNPRGQLAKTQAIETINVANTRAVETISAAKTSEAVAYGVYFCKLGDTVHKIDEINREIEKVRSLSADAFAQDVFDAFPGEAEFKQKTTDYPLFAGIYMASDFIKNNCDTSVYSACVLTIFSNMNVTGVYWDTKEISPQSDLDNKIDVISIVYNCKYMAGECKHRFDAWNTHLNKFHAKSFQPILNPQSGMLSQNDSILSSLIKAIQAVQTK